MKPRSPVDHSTAKPAFVSDPLEGYAEDYSNGQLIGPSIRENAHEKRAGLTTLIMHQSGVDMRFGNFCNSEFMSWILAVFEQPTRAQTDISKHKSQDAGKIDAQGLRQNFRISQ
jgi:hypothetical protein